MAAGKPMVNFTASLGWRLKILNDYHIGPRSVGPERRDPVTEQNAKDFKKDIRERTRDVPRSHVIACDEVHVPEWPGQGKVLAHKGGEGPHSPIDVDPKGGLTMAPVLPFDKDRTIPIPVIAKGETLAVHDKYKWP
jgi:hypothetical protein